MIGIPLVEPASAAAQIFRQIRGTRHHAGKTPQHPEDDADCAGEQHYHHGGGDHQKEGVIYVRKKSEQSQSIGGKRVEKGLPPALTLSYRRASIVTVR